MDIKKAETSKQKESTQNKILNNFKTKSVKVVIYLLNGNRLTGFIKSFDDYTILLTPETLVFKNSIVSVSGFKARDDI